METEYARDMMTGAPGTKATLVLGGTGKTGRRVVEQLGARDIPLRVGSHSGEPPLGWEDKATWEPALRDVERSLCQSTVTPSLAHYCAHLISTSCAAGLRGRLRISTVHPSVFCT
jgi:hypothetical protein